MTINKYTIAGMALLAISLTGCKEKKSTTMIITEKPKKEVPSKPHKTGDYQQTRTVEWRGTKYTLLMSRKADSSLPLTGEANNRYYDNRIQLKITRPDGSTFFNRTFTKTFFQSYVDDIYYKDGALLGIVFFKANSDNLVFAASVGNPDASSDEYVPLVLKISPNGTLSISKDTQLDTGANDSAEE